MSKNRILIIDDEKDLCFFLKANLTARGDYHVRVATSGEDGLYLAERFKPHLIILDIIMPVMDGFKVLEELKKNPKTMAMPVLMLSAKHDDESKIEASGLYCEGYMTKPVRIDDLQRHIRKILNLRRLR
jgi:two-component system alkaline phosphatase synthesis response regulator PhoP